MSFQVPGGLHPRQVRPQQHLLREPSGSKVGAGTGGTGKARELVDVRALGKVLVTWALAHHCRSFISWQRGCGGHSHGCRACAGGWCGSGRDGAGLWGPPRENGGCSGRGGGMGLEGRDLRGQLSVPGSGGDWVRRRSPPPNPCAVRSERVTGWEGDPYRPHRALAQLPFLEQAAARWPSVGSHFRQPPVCLPSVQPAFGCSEKGTLTPGRGAVELLCRWHRAHPADSASDETALGGSFRNSFGTVHGHMFSLLW